MFTVSSKGKQWEMFYYQQHHHHEKLSCKMSDKKETCPGVFSLGTASWIIAFLQLFYNVFYVLQDITIFNTIVNTVDQTQTADHSYIAVSVTYCMGSLVADFVGICAAIVLGIGNCL